LCCALISEPALNLYISNSDKVRSVQNEEGTRKHYKMKKIVTKTIAYFLAVLVIVTVPSIVIDPYNVFHTQEPRDNGIASNKSFIKTEYIKKHHDEFDSLLFGSSRAGFVDIGYLNEMTGGRFYDMASSESLVSEQTVELREIIKSGFTPKRVWVLVDDISCFVSPSIHENMLYRVPYPTNMIERTEFYLKYTDLIMNIDSLSVINETKEKKAVEQSEGIDSSYDNSTRMSYLDRYYHTGTERLDKESRFNPDEEQYQKGYWVDYYSLRTDEAVSDMREMVELCSENGIELTLITNPLYCLTYQKGLENGYLNYLESLAEVTNYYNFSSFNDVTEDYTYYYETSHFMPSVTRLMIDCVCSDYNSIDKEFYMNLEKQGFGLLVTKDNVKEVTGFLYSQAADRGIETFE